jgi:hypothetical protein
MYHALLMSERVARMFEYSLEHLRRKTGDVAGHGCADVEGQVGDKTRVVVAVLSNSDSLNPALPVVEH